MNIIRGLKKAEKTWRLDIFLVDWNKLSEARRSSFVSSCFCCSSLWTSLMYSEMRLRSELKEETRGRLLIKVGISQHPWSPVIAPAFISDFIMEAALTCSGRREKR